MRTVAAARFENGIQPKKVGKYPPFVPFCLPEGTRATGNLISSDSISALQRGTGFRNVTF